MVTAAHELPILTAPAATSPSWNLAACAVSVLVCWLTCVLAAVAVTAFLTRYASTLPARALRRPAWLSPRRVAVVMSGAGTLIAVAAAHWLTTVAAPASREAPRLLLGALVASEGLVAALLAAAACCDLACHRLPNRLLLPAGLLAAAHTLTAAWFLGTPLYPWWLAALAGAVLYGLAGLRGIGLGDVKLVVVTLTWLVPLGWEADANGLVWALVTAGVVAGGGRLSGRLSRGQTLALGPYLVAGALAARLAAAF